ncbi:MAG TPA: DUF3310 domain-containing protein [Rhodanobacter sp.]|nr:DUF3310 domain-containing protein [Rhodanobacter sp.]
MHAHTPPFTRPTAKQVYDETSAIAAAQDASLYAAPADPVNHPAHYTGGDVECIDAIRAALTEGEFIGFLKGQVLKYVWRNGKKGDPVEDAAKGLWYQRRLHGALDAQYMRRKHALAELVRDAQKMGVYDAPATACGTTAEAAYLRKCGIGDVAVSATTVASQHPMAAEVLRDEYERGAGETGL